MVFKEMFDRQTPAGNRKKFPKVITVKISYITVLLLQLSSFVFIRFDKLVAI